MKSSGARRFDFDVGGGFDEGRDSGVVDVAFAVGDEGRNHLLDLCCERKADTVGFGGLERIS